MVGPEIQPNPAAHTILNTLGIPQSDILRVYHLLECSLVADSSFFLPVWYSVILLPNLPLGETLL